MRRKKSAKAYIRLLPKMQQEKLKEIEIYTKQMMTVHGVGHYKFTFSRQKRAAGYCTPTTISLNADYCLRASFEDINNTILHEIALLLWDRAMGIGKFGRK